MADGLEIRIAADVASALEALKSVQKELKNTKGAGEDAGKGTDTLTDKFKKLPQSANGAAVAMVNLNRVVQDAPFGFIGIANNLDQLFQSFQQLQANTKNSGGAIKALRDSLSGPAGLALGFSVVTAAITFAQVGLRNWVRGTKDAGKSTDEATKAVERFNEVQRLAGQSTVTVQGIAAGSAASDIAQVNALVSVIKNQTLSYQQRNNALLELQRINKNYFGDLNLEQTSLEKLTQRVNEYSQALVAAEVVKLYKERVAQAAVSLNDQVEAERKLQAALNAATAERDAAAKAIQVQTRTDAERERGLVRLGKAEGQVIKIERDLVTQGERITQSQKAFTEFNKALKGAIDLSTQFKPLSAAPAPVKKIKEEDFFELDVLGLEEEAKGFIFKFSNYMKKIAKENKLNLAEMFSDVNRDPFKNLSKAGRDLQKYFQPVNEFEGFKNLTGFQKDLANSAKIISDTLTPSLDAMILAIGRGENAFKAFGEGVKAILLQVIQKLVSTAILAALLSAIPGFGSATGTTGFGNIFGKLLGFPGRALGGPVSGGSPYLVGERGPELFVPSVSGGIVPNNSVSSFLGGRMSGGGGSVLRGQDILLAYARTQRSQLRVNG